MLRPLFATLALTVSAFAAAQPADAPGRVARLAYVEGSISYQEANEPATEALPDRPLQPGDRLATAGDGRAELTLGSAMLRLDKASDLAIADLGASSVRFELTRGAAIVKLDELLEGESFALTTPNTTVHFKAPGEYRVDVPDEGTTTLTVRKGDAEVETAEGPVRIVEGQRVRLEGGEALAGLVAPQWTDDFDNWVLDREVQVAEVAPPTDESSEYYGDGTLDSYGEWRDDPDYGRVWMPSYAYGGYDPFGAGYWAYNGYGYSWVDPMPWSPYTYHYGHRTYLPQYNRYGWVAERRRELRRRIEDRDDTVDRVLQDARRRDLIPDTRPASGSRDAERRVQATADELARRLEATRRAAPQPVSEPGQASRNAVEASRNAAAAQRNAAAAAAAAAARGNASTSTARPAQPAASSSSTTRPRVQAPQAPRPSLSIPSSSNKTFGKPQER